MNKPDDQTLMLIGSLIFCRSSRAESSFTKDEAIRVVEWGRQTRLDQVTLDLVLEGEISVDVDPDGELRFHRNDGAEADRCRDLLRRIVAGEVLPSWAESSGEEGR